MHFLSLVVFKRIISVLQNANLYVNEVQQDILNFLLPIKDNMPR